MGTAQLCLVGLAMLAGLLAVLAPGLPGPLVCWAATLWWAGAVHTALAWYVLFGSAVVLAAGQAGKWLAPGRRAREAGITRQTLALAGVCAIAAFFAVPVLGAIPAFVGAIYAQERVRLGSHGAARVSTRRAMRAVGLSVLAELFSCLLVAGAWLGAVLAT
ncbi:DUF456 domain-containing protein [Streptomyces sp. PTM05]|uniref:DUF456 domain-containing protein n=1 Tax=Streptantibioticus parmotrematis TaxID=2873249 RepID=A0ABS7QSR2_9ACTN|nr:DUF456 domain-containing protein [Streptantibioticus parmotrematis]MBY8885796.1 DUF456 domain-containing protein [Streptantibioticus parmotrematis]